MDKEARDVNLILRKTRRKLETDPDAAMSMIIMARSLYPNSFSIQFELYKLHKAALDYEEAAICFQKCHNILKFSQQNSELTNEVTELTWALRALESELKPLQDFYVRMFHHLSYDVQHKILQMTVNYMESSLNQCRLLLLILKKFPQASFTHLPRLLQMIADCMKTDPPVFQAMLLDQVMPFAYVKAPEMNPILVSHLYTVSLECFIRQIIEDDQKGDTNEIWKKIFNVLGYCAHLLGWELFLPFNKAWGQNIYWGRLIEIVAASPPGSMQVLIYATTLFIYSLHCYIRNCNTNVDDVQTNHVLVEGFSEWNDRKDNSLDAPQITITTAASKDISMAFSHAAQCWQLLNTEQFQRDFSKLLLSLPLAVWISRFLFDLSIYFGHREEAKKLMTEISVNSNLVANIQILSLNMLHGGLTLQGFECISKIIADLPPTAGQYLDHLTLQVPRHMIFMPLTQKPLIQYCAKALANTLARKLFEPTVTDRLIGDLLVLLQLEYPDDPGTVDQAFSLMVKRGSFSYPLFTTYIVNIEYMEQFMVLLREEENVHFDLTPAQTAGGLVPRHLAMRGSDKWLRDENRLIIRQQIARANDNIITLVAGFMNQEKVQLMQHLLGS